MRAYVAAGTNLGDRWGHLALAARELRAQPAVRLTRASRVYESAPMGPPQPRYLNAALELETALAPERLLGALQAVERAALRRRDVRWGPRTLDLDLIWYEGEERSDERLTLPHARAHEREFVLRPLADLDPGLVLRGRPVGDWLAGLDPQGVEPTGTALM